MIRKHWKVGAVVLGMAFSVWFLLDPDPLPMALYVFVAQPLFLAVLIGYILSIWKDLRRKKVL